MSKKLAIYGFSSNLLVKASHISNKKISRNYHNQLKNKAMSLGFASLSSVQVGDSYRAFIMLSQSSLKNKKWNNYNSLKQTHFNSFFNPQIIDVSQESTHEWEICPSYPGIQMLISRPSSIKYNYQNQFLKTTENELFSGFSARVFQHQFDHIEGIQLLRKADEVKIINERLREKHENQVNGLLKEFKKSIEQDKSDKNYWQNESFKKLKRLIVYSIIDAEK